jgi:hypothetical protein
MALVLAGCGGGSGDGCKTDNDCKGTRICVAGMCVENGGNGNPDLSGGGGGGNPDLSMGGGGNPDLAVPLDFAVPADLSMPDLSVLFDLKSVDLVDSATPLDLLPPPIPDGATCTSTQFCAAPAGESSFCANGYGTPLCAHTCNLLPDYGLCEDGKGICIPVGGNTKYCLPKCGDAEAATCGNGAACAALGFRGANRVGVCVPNCSIITSSPDTCKAAGLVCDDTAGNCLPTSCGTKTCRTGATCSSGKCNPTSPMNKYASCTSSNTTASVCTDDFCIANALGGFCSNACDTSATGLAKCGSPSAGVCWVDTEANGTLHAGVTANDAGTDIYYGGSFNNTGGRQAGVCMKACSIDADCPSIFGWRCANTYGGKACIPDSVAAPPTINAGSQQPGDPCASNTDCATGACAISTNWTYGICQRASTGVACPSGTQPNATSPLVCNKICTGTQGDECPPSQQCNPNLTNGLYCEVAVCRTNADCNAVTGTCDPQSGRCVSSIAGPPDLSNLGAVGDPCPGGGAWCVSGSCFPASSTWPNGYCTSLCTILDDFTDTCPTGSACSSFFAAVQGVCLDLCDTGTTVSRFGSCRAGYSCKPFTGADDRFGFCLM